MNLVIQNDTNAAWGGGAVFLRSGVLVAGVVGRSERDWTRTWGTRTILPLSQKKSGLLIPCLTLVPGPGTFTFPGNVFHRNRRKARKLGERIANIGMNFVSTPSRIQLGFFCDGSFKSKQEPSGVGVVFRRFRPLNGADQSPGHGMKVAGYELEKIGPASALDTDTIDFRFFSDSLGLITEIKSGRVSDEVDTHHVARGRLLFAICRAAERLSTKAISLGYRCNLELHWIKAHNGRNAYHTAVDEMAKMARTVSGGTIARIEGVGEVPCPVEPFPAGLLVELDEIAATTEPRSQGLAGKRQRVSTSGHYRTLALRPGKASPSPPEEFPDDLELPFSKMR
ncbi:hypothetical protein V8F20_004209 [Naviculisporaceae sp. PSN 640]